MAMLAAAIAVVCVFCSLFAGWVAPHNPFDLSTLELSDARLPGIELDLVLRGATHRVLFDHAKGGFSARPIWKLVDGEITGELLYLPTFKFLKV